MDYGSLFTGFGGLDLGLEWAGLRCKWQVENNDYARSLLQRYWPGIPRYTDVRAVCRDDLADVDLICGGFPCQDISTAGKQSGITGERSGLWKEFRRIIEELRPQYVLIENVAALRYKERGLGTVLQDLATLLYNAEGHCIPATYVGAPHVRDRIFIVAYTDSFRRSSRRFCETGAGRGGSAPSNKLTRPVPCENWKTTPVGLRGVVNGVSPGVGRAERVELFQGLGNAVVPQLGQMFGRAILDLDRRRRET